MFSLLFLYPRSCVHQNRFSSDWRIQPRISFRLSYRFLRYRSTPPSLSSQTKCTEYKGVTSYSVLVVDFPSTPLLKRPSKSFTFQCIRVPSLFSRMIFCKVLTVRFHPQFEFWGLKNWFTVTSSLSSLMKMDRNMVGVWTCCPSG